MRDNDLMYKKEYIRPMMTPQHVYVFRFGKHRLNNRLSRTQSRKYGDDVGDATEHQSR